MSSHRHVAKVHHHKPKSQPWVDAFIKLALPAARATKIRWGVPVSVLIAQSAQETGWGRHVVQNAYFGIKGSGPGGASVSFKTTEDIGGKVVHEIDAFRAYTGFAQSADDYGRFLSSNPRYKKAFLHKNDPARFVQEMAKAGYATDPHYAHEILGIIHAHHLTKYDK